jgi:SAM-dependent methyltransferase
MRLAVARSTSRQGRTSLSGNVSVTRKVDVRGEGAQASIIKAATEKYFKIVGGAFSKWKHTISHMGFDTVQVRYGHSSSDYGNGCSVVQCEIFGATTGVYYGHHCWLTAIVECMIHNCTTGVHFDFATAASGSGTSMVIQRGGIFNCTTGVYVQGNTTDGHDIKLTDVDVEHCTSYGIRYEPNGDGTLFLQNVHMELNDDTYVKQLGGNLFVDGLWAFPSGTTHNRVFDIDGDGRCWLHKARLQWQDSKLVRLRNANAKLIVNSDDVFSVGAFFGAGSVVMDDGGSTAGQILNGGMAYGGRYGKVFTGQQNVDMGTLNPGPANAITLAQFQKFDHAPRVIEFDLTVASVAGVNTNAVRILLNPGGTCFGLGFPPCGRGRPRAGHLHAEWPVRCHRPLQWDVRRGSTDGYDRPWDAALPRHVLDGLATQRRRHEDLQSLRARPLRRGGDSGEDPGWGHAATPPWTGRGSRHRISRTSSPNFHALLRARNVGTACGVSSSSFLSSRSGTAPLVCYAVSRHPIGRAEVTSVATTAESRMWKRLFQGEPHHITEFHRVVRERAFPGTTLLDIGCGDNAAFDDLRSAGRVVWGVDFQRHPRLVAPEFFLLLPTNGSLPFPAESFDVVTALWVLEHVRDPVPFLREVGRVLRSGGVFLAHSISGDHYVTWIRRALQLLPHRWIQGLVERLYGRAAFDTFPTYYRLNTRRQIARAARETGLVVQHLERYAGPCYFAFHRWAFDAAVAADWLMESLFGCGRIYFWVALERQRQSRGHAEGPCPPAPAR